MGIKGMKTVFASSSTAILAFFGKVFFSQVHPAISNASAVIGLLSGIGALALMIFTIRKNIVETDKTKEDQRHEAAKFEAWLMERCNNCANPERCAFPEHRPPNCKHRTKV